VSPCGWPLVEATKRSFDFGPPVRSSAVLSWVKAVSVNTNSPVSAAPDWIDEDARVAAIARLHELVALGRLSVERFSGSLDQVFAALSHSDLEAALLGLPPLVRLTPPSRRLRKPLVLRVPDGDLRLGSGWQLAADTTIGTGFGSARLDLTAASWDAEQIDLRLETWGSIEVLVRAGVSVQVVGGSASVNLERLAVPVPGGPVLRVSTHGPAGTILIRHPTTRADGLFMHARRRRMEPRQAPVVDICSPPPGDHRR